MRVKKEIEKRNESGLEITDNEKEILMSTVASGLSDKEFGLFLSFCERKGLDPFLKEIHAIKRKGKLTFQMGIDGLRHLGEKTGLYSGQQIEYFDKKAERWTQVWTREEPPAAAKCILFRKDFAAPVITIAHWQEYAKTGEEGFMWRKMKCTMIAKCAEALAWRKAFPRETGGLYEQAEISANAEPEENENNVREIIESDAALQEPGVQKEQKRKKTDESEQQNHFKPTKETYSKSELESLFVSFKTIKENYDNSELLPSKLTDEDSLEIEGELVSSNLLKDLKKKVATIGFTENQTLLFLSSLTNRRVANVENLTYPESAALAVLFYDKQLTRKAITSLITVEE